MGCLWSRFLHKFLEYAKNVGQSSLGIVVENGKAAAFVAVDGPLRLAGQFVVVQKVRTNPRHRPGQAEVTGWGLLNGTLAPSSDWANTPLIQTPGWESKLCAASARCFVVISLDPTNSFELSLQGRSIATAEGAGVAEEIQHNEFLSVVAIVIG